MAYELIPGIRQDHKGKCYQLARYPNGKLIQVPAQPAALSAATQAMLEPIEVESQAKRGTFYKSLRCFQGITI